MSRQQTLGTSVPPETPAHGTADRDHAMEELADVQGRLLVLAQELRSRIMGLQRAAAAGAYRPGTMKTMLRAIGVDIVGFPDGSVAIQLPLSRDGSNLPLFVTTGCWSQRMTSSGEPLTPKKIRERELRARRSERDRIAAATGDGGGV